MNVICGLNASEIQPVHKLFNCADNFPPDMMDWFILKSNDLILYYKLFSVIAHTVVLANLMIIVGVLRDKKVRMHQHFLQVAGQALTDLIVGLLSVVYFQTTLMNGGSLWGQQLMCDIFGYGVVAACHTTVFSLAWIAYNRKIRVLDNRSISTRRMLMLYVLFVWVDTLVILFYYSRVGTVRMLSR